MRIRRYCLQALVLDGCAHAEVIEALELVAFQPEEIVAGVVEVEADAGGANAGGLRLKVQHLAENTRLPEKPAIPPGAVGLDAVGELGDHAKTEDAGGGDLLIAADHLRSRDRRRRRL